MILQTQDIPQFDLTAYSQFWLETLSSLADVLREKLGEGDALNLLKGLAMEQGVWTPELMYLGLRILKPAVLPLGSEVAA